MNNNYYTILGVDKNATPQQIKIAYEKQINNPNLTMNQKNLIIKAYQTLSDEKKRYDYDLINDNIEYINTPANHGRQQKKDQTNRVYQESSFKIKDISKWKLYMWLILALVIAILIAIIITWGFIQLFPVIVAISIFVLIIKILKR